MPPKHKRVLFAYEIARHTATKISLAIDIRDLWIGIFWDTCLLNLSSDIYDSGMRQRTAKYQIDIYLCLLPALVLHFETHVKVKR